MEIRIEDSECSSSDNEEFTRSEEAENCVNISVTSFENLESLEYATTVNYRGKRKYMVKHNQTIRWQTADKLFDCLTILWVCLLKG